MGRPKASVLPLPVCAAPMMSSRSLIAAGRHWRWISEGCLKPWEGGERVQTKKKMAGMNSAASICPLFIIKTATIGSTANCGS